MTEDRPAPALVPDATLELLARHPKLVFAALFGSRARGDARADSDWDIAVQWQAGEDWFALLGEHEQLRAELARSLGVDTDAVDLVDLRGTNLALRSAVADEGVPLADRRGTAWPKFQCQAWRELEYDDWYRRHAV